MRWLAAGALVLGCLGYAQPAAAEFFQFSTSVPVGGLTNMPSGAIIMLASEGSVSPGDNLDASAPGTDIVFADIFVSGVTRLSPLEGVNIPYMLDLSVSDFPTDTGLVPTASATFHISGTITGSIGSGKKVNLINTFSPANVLSLQIGPELYTITALSFIPPGPTNSGGFGAHIISTANLPEPGTLSLLALGSFALATPALRRWRRNSPRTGS